MAVLKTVLEILLSRYLMQTFLKSFGSLKVISIYVTTDLFTIT